MGVYGYASDAPEVTGDWGFPYGGHNDAALLLVSKCGLDVDDLALRAQAVSGAVSVKLRCSDIFAWACADAEILPPSEFAAFLAAAEAAWTGVSEEAFNWFAAAYSVKLRGVAPQKLATDRYPAFVEMLDWLGVPWREWKRYDQMSAEDA